MSIKPRKIIASIIDQHTSHVIRIDEVELYSFLLVKFRLWRSEISLPPFE